MEKTWTFDDIDMAILRVAVADHLATLREDQQKDNIPEEEIEHVDELTSRLNRRRSG